MSHFVLRKQVLVQATKVAKIWRELDEERRERERIREKQEKKDG